MEAANTVIIVMGILLAIVIIFGIYKLATSNFTQHSSLTPTTKSTQRVSAVRILLYIVFTVIALLGVFAAYHALVSQ